MPIVGKHQTLSDETLLHQQAATVSWRDATQHYYRVHGVYPVNLNADSFARALEEMEDKFPPKVEVVKAIYNDTTYQITLRHVGGGPMGEDVHFTVGTKGPLLFTEYYRLGIGEEVTLTGTFRKGLLGVGEPVKVYGCPSGSRSNSKVSGFDMQFEGALV